MDLAQKGNRVKRELQAAAHKPEATSIRHAIEAFDAFVDGVVEEIGQLKAAMKSSAANGSGESPGLGESGVPQSATPDVADSAETSSPTENPQAERELERQPS